MGPLKKLEFSFSVIIEPLYGYFRRNRSREDRHDEATIALPSF